MSLLLESLTAAEEAAEQAAAEAYRDLVRQLGAGVDLELPDVQRVLAAVNKNATQLASDVHDIQHEKSLLETAAIRDAALDEQVEIGKRITAAIEAFKAAEVLYIQTCQPLEIRKQQIQSLVVAGGEADAALSRRKSEGRSWL